MKTALAIAFVIGWMFSAPVCRAQAGPSTPTPATAAASAESTPAAILPDQQATTEQVEKLFEVMHLRDQIESSMKIMQAMVQRQLAKDMPTLPAGKQLTPDQRQAVQNLLSRYVEKSMNLFTPDELAADMVTVYKRHFTRADVDAYIAFYSSPAGQHLLSAQPLIMQEYMPIIMQRVRQRGKALAEQQQKDMDELLKSFGITPQPSPDSSGTAPTSVWPLPPASTPAPK